MSDEKANPSSLSLGEAIIYQCFMLMDRGLDPLSNQGIKVILKNTLDLIDITEKEVLQCLSWLQGDPGGGCHGEFFRSFCDENSKLSLDSMSSFLKLRNLI